MDILYCSTLLCSISSFPFQNRYLILTRKTLSIHKSKTSYLSLLVIQLDQVTFIERSQKHKFGLDLQTNLKDLVLKCKSDMEIVTLLDLIYANVPSSISAPSNHRHITHVSIDDEGSMIVL